MKTTSYLFFILFTLCSCVSNDSQENQDSEQFKLLAEVYNDAINDTQSLLIEISHTPAEELDILVSEQVNFTKLSAASLPTELEIYADKYSEIYLENKAITPLIHSIANDDNLSVNNKIFAVKTFGGLSAIMEKQTERELKVSNCKEQFKRDIKSVIDNYFIGMICSGGNPVAIMAVVYITYRETDRAEEAYYDCIK